MPDYQSPNASPTALPEKPPTAVGLTGFYMRCRAISIAADVAAKKVKEAETIPLRAFRCPRCGLVECYAKDQA